VGRVRHDQVDIAGVEGRLEPPDEEPAEQRGPAELAVVLHPLDDAAQDPSIRGRHLDAHLAGPTPSGWPQ
jgi:hypothetical protein